MKVAMTRRSPRALAVPFLVLVVLLPLFSACQPGCSTIANAIDRKHCELGGAASVLGAPTSAEYAVAGGRGRDYQRGVILYTTRTGAHEVHGGIHAQYQAGSGPAGRLGFPITDEYAVNGGRQSDFQNGFIRWSAATRQARVVLLDPYTGAGTWVTRFRFSREYAGPAPAITPAHVDAMAAAGVHVIYLQAAADDPRYPGLLSPDLLGEFLTRAHARGLRVVAWYLPHLTDVNADLARLKAIVDFRAGGQRFDAVALDIEDTSVTDVRLRNARLVDEVRRLRALAPGVTLGAIVLPPVVTDVLNTAYWPDFPWRALGPDVDVWLPMSYWSNRTPGSVYRDPYRYTEENIRRVRWNIGEPCAAVSTIGGFGTGVTAGDYAAMARAARDQGAIGVSIFDWTTTPGDVWGQVRGYATRGC